MGNEWASSSLRSCHLQEKVELPVGSTRKSLPWELYRAVSSDAGAGALSVFVYSYDTVFPGSDGRHSRRPDVLQSAENNAKVVPLSLHQLSQRNVCSPI